MLSINKGIASTSLLHYIINIWLGRKDSNLRMRAPKTRDLPLVDAPKADI